MSVRLRFEELAKKVMKRVASVGCSSCVVVCPYKGILEYSDRKPRIAGECKICSICVRICPRYSF